MAKQILPKKSQKVLAISMINRVLRVTFPSHCWGTCNLTWTLGLSKGLVIDIFVFNKIFVVSTGRVLNCTCLNDKKQLLQKHLAFGSQMPNCLPTRMISYELWLVSFIKRINSLWQLESRELDLVSLAELESFEGVSHWKFKMLTCLVHIGD